LLLCPGVSEKYAAAKVLNAVGIFAKIRKKTSFTLSTLWSSNSCK